jgi:hypothetical protein
MLSTATNSWPSHGIDPYRAIAAGEPAAIISTGMWVGCVNSQSRARLHTAHRSS